MRWTFGIVLFTWMEKLVSRLLEMLYSGLCDRGFDTRYSSHLSGPLRNPSHFKDSCLKAASVSSDRP